MAPTTNSDSEDDPDYVPPVDGNDLDSSSDERDDAVEHAAETASHHAVPAEQKKQRDALWASFQASVSAPLTHANASADATASSSPTAKLVKIEKIYLFAGKHVTEVVQVPEDSEEAKKWPRWSPPDKTEMQAQGRGGDVGEVSGDREPAPPPAAVDTRSTTVTAGVPSTASSASMSMSTPVTRPGPRKPRTALPSIPKASQAKKITTLDKCAMDWGTHVASQSSDVQDELNVNRRGGGYLEKMEFLRRVEDRREDAFEASKANKRRKT